MLSGFTMEAAMYTRPYDPVEFQLGLSIMLGFFFSLLLSHFKFCVYLDSSRLGG
jgi:hypothetical protein